VGDANLAEMTWTEARQAWAAANPVTYNVQAEMGHYALRERWVLERAGLSAPAAGKTVRLPTRGSRQRKQATPKIYPNE
jgi:hypothetical protein